MPERALYFEAAYLGLLSDSRSGRSIIACTFKSGICLRNCRIPNQTMVHSGQYSLLRLVMAAQGLIVLPSFTSPATWGPTDKVRDRAWDVTACQTDHGIFSANWPQFSLVGIGVFFDGCAGVFNKMNSCGDYSLLDITRHLVVCTIYFWLLSLCLGCICRKVVWCVKSSTQNK